MPPRSFRLDRNLGDEEQLAALIKTIEALGGNFSLYLDPQAALFLDSGYSARNDLAMSITSLNLEGYNRQKPNYFLNYEALSSRYSSLSADVFELQAGFALDGIGSVLYSDFKRGHFLDRENAIRMMGMR